MRKTLMLFGISLLFIILSIKQAVSCSTFCLSDNENIVYGRSYDWDIGYGYIMVNHCNVKKIRYLPYDETPSMWTSKYGSITFNQYGKEYPIGGMNETGLIVQAMTLIDTQYPEQDERPALDELGWVQYQLDNSASIQDVIESDKDIRISNKTLAKLHFLITDSTGNTLVVEFLNGKGCFYFGENLPQKCLTNNTYSHSLSYLKNHNGFGGEETINYKDHSSENSLERFTIIADMIRKYKANSKFSLIDYSFGILDNVKDVKRSQFQIVYDIKQKEIYFRSLQSNKIKSVNLKYFNFDCKSEAMMIDINTCYHGNINDKFIPYNSKANKQLILKAYTETGFNLPESILLELGEWPENVSCVRNK